MISFFEIQWKAGALLSLGVLLYYFFLSKDIFFLRNRIWLLACLLVPWIIQLFSMPVWIRNFLFEERNIQATPLFLESNKLNNIPIQEVVYNDHLNWEHIALWIFIVISMFFMFRLLIGFVAIQKLRSQSIRHNYKGLPLRILKKNDIHPFSFFRTIYAPKLINKLTNKHLILEHEMTHCKQLHSIDIVLADVVLLFQWWNPFAWWLRKLIAQNHEYYVDNYMYQKVSNPKEYQYLLVEVLSKNNSLQFVNNFNGSFIKKRIVMMNQNKSNQKYKIWKVVPVLLIGVCSLLAFTNPNTTETNQKNDSVNQQKNILNNPEVDNSYDHIATDSIVVNNENVILYGDNVELTSKSNNNSINFINRKNISQTNQVTKAKYASEKDNLKSDISDSKSKENQRISNEILNKDPLILINGIKSTKSQMNALASDEISSVNVIKDSDTLKSFIEEYGEDAKDGVILITLKSSNEDSKEVHYVTGYPIRDPHNLEDFVKTKNPSIFVEGNTITSTDFLALDENKIKLISILNEKDATEMYGDKGKNGVIVVSLNQPKDENSDETVTVKAIPKSNTAQLPESINNSIKGKKPYFIVDGKPITYKEFKKLDSDQIESISVLKDKNAIDRYGDKAKNGVILVTTKK